jgi:hypothetical protein
MGREGFWEKEAQCEGASFVKDKALFGISYRAGQKCDFCSGYLPGG